MDADRRHMGEALRLALKGLGRTRPNPAVGAVVVKDGVVAGRGFHERAGGPHAEAAALLDAGERARGATLYVTLEPCSHHGRTPPCTEAILRAGVARVVYATDDPNPEVSGGGASHLMRRGVAVEGGCREFEARLLNQAFFKHVTTGLPYVTLKAAATLDGRIATAAGDSRWVTGARARAMVHALRARAGAVLVGIGTARADDPLLTARPLPRGMVQPLRVVLDTHLRLPLGGRLAASAREVPVLCACAEDAPRAREEALRAAGVEVARLPSDSRGVKPHDLLRLLGRRGVQHLLVEGGGAVHGSFVAAGCADALWLFFAPKVLGGGVSAFSFEAPGLMSGAVRVHGLSVRRVGDDLLVSGRFREALY